MVARIYVASSWRNPHQPAVVDALRAEIWPLRLWDDPARFCHPEMPPALLHAARETGSQDYDAAACGERMAYLHPGDPENEATADTEPTCPACRAMLGLS